MNLYVGTSGFSYKEWKGSFYPKGLPNHQMLRFYGERFRAVEINSTFKRLPTSSVLEAWAGAVGGDFKFALKASEQITHYRRLKEVSSLVSDLFRVTATLKGRLGPVFFQLPPNFKKDVTRLRAFLGLLPSRRRVALEFRHDSWFDEEVFTLLRQKRVALCIADAEGDLEVPFVATAAWGYHPLQTSDALGAAASGLGADAQAAVVDFNKQAGMSHGKISRVFQTLFGIRLSRGGSTHVVLRAARRAEPVYASICQTLPQAPWIAPDETGWHVGGRPAWLHTLVGPDATAYIIDPTRSGDVAERLLGIDYGGIMIHDGWSPYDRFVNASHQQCLRHLLRRSRELLETATRGAVRFPRRVQALLQKALAARDRAPRV